MLRLVIVPLCAGALVLAACEPLGNDELRREVEGIHSVAAEGAVLGNQIATQDTKRAFARVQARVLADSAEHSAERLTDAHPASGLQPAVAHSISLADGVSTAVCALEVAPDDAERAARTSKRLERLARRATRLAESL
jgi:hypothetical protein